jgi:hypothetical protein
MRPMLLLMMAEPVLPEIPYSRTIFSFSLLQNPSLAFNVFVQLRTPAQ